MDRISEKTDSKFRFVLLAAHRAEQLIRGARPRVDVTSPKISKVAMEELLADTVNWDYGPAPEAAAEEAGEEVVEPAEGDVH